MSKHIDDIVREELRLCAQQIRSQVRLSLEEAHSLMLTTLREVIAERKSSNVDRLTEENYRLRAELELLRQAKESEE